LPSVMSSATSPFGKHSEIIVISVPGFAINRSPSYRNRDHDRPESLITMPRNPHTQRWPLRDNSSEQKVTQPRGKARDDKFLDLRQEAVWPIRS
jgi:hypothetical protein